MNDHRQHTMHDHRGHATRTPGDTGTPAQAHSQGPMDDAPHAHHAAEHAGEELGAAATHGHAVMAHAEGAAHDHHDGHQGGHGAHGGGHAGHSEAMFKRPFWVALALTIPVLIYAEHIQMLLGYTAPAFPGSRWLEPVLASVIYWYGGWVFLTGAVAELRARQPGMMTLVALAITTAYFYSLAVTFGLVAGMPFYWELATLSTSPLVRHAFLVSCGGIARQTSPREMPDLWRHA